MRPASSPELSIRLARALISYAGGAPESRWSLIANQLPGRTGNDVRNCWNTKLSKQLRQRGIDPTAPSPTSCTSSPAPSPYGDDGAGEIIDATLESWTATRRRGWTSSSPSCWPTRPTTLAPPPRWAGSWA
ncbi:uncharacterized protein [Zea mays]|uniref:uncharacterized protein isoform X1 n=1 Tax=Zea mays TaxID=4577 RepID=UPI0001BA74EF|nr:uncharacterized protein LOC100274293 isoform X1 [Zea mays]|eukprot:XP_008658316.1 hypothetical protein [Zea mays]